MKKLRKCVHICDSALRMTLMHLLLVVFCSISLLAVPTATAPLRCSDPVLAVPASVEIPKPSPSEKIVVDPSQLDLKVYSASDTATITIQNSTATTINEISFSSLGLLDGKTGIPIPSWNWSLELNTQLKPNERTDCTFDLPVSDHAGAFTGILRVGGGGRIVPVPLTLRMRGPYVPVWNGFPLLFLTTVFLCGWGLSLWLDNWYTKQLPLVQVVLLLREQQDALKRFLDELTAWEKKYSAVLTQATGAAIFDKSTIDSMLKRVDSIQLAPLQQAEQGFDLACRLNDVFWTALQIAERTFPNNLPQIGHQLDLVDRGTEPERLSVGTAASSDDSRFNCVPRRPHPCAWLRRRVGRYRSVQGHLGRSPPPKICDGCAERLCPRYCCMDHRVHCVLLPQPIVWKCD